MDNSQGFFSMSNLKSGCIGAGFGLICFIASFFVLFINEANYVKNINMAQFMKKNVVSVSTLSQENNGKLIHYTGVIKTNDIYSDEYIRINTPAIDRKVEMLQWQEIVRKDPNTDAKKYTYEKEWSEREISSEFFRNGNNEKYKNPPMQIKSKKFRANEAELGEFTLGRELVRKLRPEQDVILNQLSQKYQINDGSIIYIKNPQRSDGIGDLQISYKYIPTNTNISVIAAQSNKSLTVFKNQKHNIALTQTGTYSAKEMISNFEQQKKLAVNIFRILGCILMLIGISILISPITTMLSFIPIIGRIGNNAIGLLVALLTVTLSAITIAVAWISVRPIIAIPVILLAAYGIYYYLTTNKLKNKYENKIN